MAEKKTLRIVLGVTGSIAAFRAADLASAMTKEGWEVHAILTQDGARFLPALTLAALTHRPVHTSLWEEGEGGGPPRGLPGMFWGRCCWPRGLR